MSEPAVDNPEPARTSRLTRATPVTGNSIDLTTGRVLLDQTDVDLPGVLPLVVGRSHRSDLRAGRGFGAAWMSTVDQVVVVRDGVVHFVNADGMVLTYPEPDESGAPVFPVHGTPWPLRRRPGGGFTVVDQRHGRALRFAPTGAERLPITSVADRNGNHLDLVRGGSGELVEIEHSAGRRVAVATTDGLITELSLADDDGPDVVLKRYRYDERHRLVEVVSPSGSATAFEYDDTGRLARWTDPNGMSYRYRYDGSGRCVEATGTAGYLDRALAYDDGVTRCTDSLGHTTAHHLNDQYQVVRTVDPLGHETRSEWDGQHHLLSRTDAAGHTTRYTYDDGWLTKVERPDGGTVLAEYNGLGLPVTVTTADGAVWRHEYDDRGNLVATADPTGATDRYDYDEHGHLVARTDPLEHVTRLENDRNGLVLATVAPDGATTRCERDLAGRVSSTTDPAGGVVRYSWTAEGRLATRTAPDGTVEQWTHEGAGNTVRRVDAAGNATGVEFDHAGLPVAEIGPDGTRTEYEYDTELRKVGVTNGNGERTTFHRDAVGDVVEEHAGNLVTTFTHDACGRVVGASNGDADVVLRRDPCGRVVAETVNGRTVASTFDLAGRRVRRHTPSGVDSVWAYDPSGRPTRLGIATGALGFAYDVAGRETGRTFGDVVLSRSWAAPDRLRTQAVIMAAAGRGQRVLRRRSYQYRDDAVLLTDQLTGARLHELDVNGRVVAVHGEGGTEWYEYDAVGNIVDAQWPAVSTDRPEHAARGDRDYAGPLLRRAGRVLYEHDRDGRVLCRRVHLHSGQTLEWRYIWDSRGHLVFAGTPDGQLWRYRHDPFGRRIGKERLDVDRQTVAERVDFTWDGGVLAEQTAAARTTTWERLPGSDIPVVQVDGGRCYAVVADLAGAPTELIAPDGHVVWEATTNLWGLQQEVRGTVACALRFPGQYHDIETGLYHSRHGCYDPVTGRYQSGPSHLRRAARSCPGHLRRTAYPLPPADGGHPGPVDATIVSRPLDRKEPPCPSSTCSPRGTPSPPATNSAPGGSSPPWPSWWD